MEKDLLLAASLDLRILPGEQAKYHRVFEPFALVDGDQPDGVFIPLQAQLMFLGRLLLRIHLLGQPLEQPADAQPPLGFRLVQDFAQVKHIGEPPLAVREGQQPLAHLLPLQPVPEHAEKAVAVPEVEVFVEALQPFLPLGFRCRPPTEQPSTPKRSVASADFTRRSSPGSAMPASTRRSSALPGIRTGWPWCGGRSGH